jgi:hypothetical protein
VVLRLFAWADVTLHEETYDEAAHDLYETECVIIDEEGDRFETDTYTEWAAGRPLTQLRPYVNEMGEVDRWRLELILNDLGKAFLVVDGFATTGERQLTL